MTPEDDKLQKLLRSLPVKMPDDAMAERIFSRAVMQPQRRPSGGLMLTRLFASLCSQWPEDMAVKAGALAAVAIITFSAGAYEAPAAQAEADINFVALAMGNMGGGMGGAL
jgi:hypothetical protein